MSPSQSYSYDVFLSFRGEDTRNTFVDHFYKALDDQGIDTYKDDISLRQGESIRPALLEAIKESRIAVIVFSKHYADSSWCLDELVHIMKCRRDRGKIVLPIFYYVEPSELRKEIKLPKKRKTSDSEWEETLAAASEIAGWVIKNTASGNEAEDIKQIVDGIRILIPSNSYVDEDLVGMEARLQDLKSKLAISYNGVRMIGIWGVGGSGKSTLATSLYEEISQNFQFKCIVENVREVSSNDDVKIKQAKMLLDIFNKPVEVQSAEEGKLKIKTMLSSEKVLVLLEYVDTLDQLEALVGKHDWFGSGSIIIITSRHNHILNNLDHLYPSRLLSHEKVRVQDLKSRLAIWSNGVHMIGIWGVGGSGKSTLATNLYMKISNHFQFKCIVENVREESRNNRLRKVQARMLSDILNTDVKVQSVNLGKREIESRLRSKKVLVLLNDVDTHDQLDALVGKHDWFGSGSIIMITSKDEQLLKAHKVDQVYPVSLLSKEEAMQLFKRYANNKKDTIEDYNRLSLRVVSYAGGLPLALKVLGASLNGRDRKGWMDTLGKLKDIPPSEIVAKLRISYDGLTPLEKELFLDIACFYKGKMKNQVMEMLEACDFHPESGIEMLRQKALVRIVDGKFDMHQLIQQMGHYIVRGDPPMNPEKHSRVWKYQEIQDMFGDATIVKENDNIEAIGYTDYSYDKYSRFCKLVSKMKKLRGLSVRMHEGKCHSSPDILSNELRYIDWKGYPASSFPDNFQLMKLVVLKLSRSMQEELWNGYKRLPHLKVLQLSNMKKLRSTPNFEGLPNLQKLTLSKCIELEKIHSSLENHKSLKHVRISKCLKLIKYPKFAQMKKLKTLELEDCDFIKKDIFSDIGELSNLEELNLSRNIFSKLDFSLSKLTKLKVLNLSRCLYLLKLPELPLSLIVLNAYDCKSLTTIGDCEKCKWLPQVSLMGGRRNYDEIFLESMCEGKDIGNQSMLLVLQGLEVANMFKPCPFDLGKTCPCDGSKHFLSDGSTCTLQLPENWFNDFCGFLICVVFPTGFSCHDSVGISMKNPGISMKNPSKHSQHVLADLKESRDQKFTWVAFVSFGSLRHTTWWKQTHNVLSFNIEGRCKCTGLRVELVDKKTTRGVTKTSSEYAPDFKIERDSACDLSISLSLLNLLQR